MFITKEAKKGYYFQVLQIILDLEMMRSHLCVGLLLLVFVEIFSPAKLGFLKIIHYQVHYGVEN